MSSMDQDARDFLLRIVWSITAGIVYLIIISTFGIMLGWFFFAEKPTTGNYIFYAWVLLSSFLLFRLLRKWWKNKFPHG